MLCRTRGSHLHAPLPALYSAGGCPRPWSRVSLRVAGDRDTPSQQTERIPWIYYESAGGWEGRGGSSGSRPAAVECSPAHIWGISLRGLSSPSAALPQIPPCPSTRHCPFSSLRTPPLNRRELLCGGTLGVEGEHRQAFLLSSHSAQNQTSASKCPINLQA